MSKTFKDDARQKFHINGKKPVIKGHKGIKNKIPVIKDEIYLEEE